jgi:23S rRNA (pseudouridine1915-N3)-methyltransferase
LRLRILAIGRSRDPAERELTRRYLDRCPWPVELVELQPRQATPAGEAAAILRRLPPAGVVVALDEQGRDVASTELAAALAAWRDRGAPWVSFVIGGADGLAPAIMERAGLRLAFGRATWPHLLVRVMLAEQLYRASTILAGHPYHRG